MDDTRLQWVREPYREPVHEPFSCGSKLYGLCVQNHACRPPAQAGGKHPSATGRTRTAVMKDGDNNGEEAIPHQRRAAKRTHLHPRQREGEGDDRVRRQGTERNDLPHVPRPVPR